MTRTKKTLHLSTETLRYLDGSSLARVAGGQPINPAPATHVCPPPTPPA